MLLMRNSLARTMKQLQHLTPLLTGTCGMAVRAGCNKNKEPRCSPENLAKSPCIAKKKAEQKEKEKEENKSMWDNPECCLDPCPDVHPRFDDLYYRPADKTKQKYHQTWVECPEIRIVPKKLCCFENVKYPPIQRREKKAKVLTACAQVNDSERMNCKRKADYRCPKLTMRGCKGAREPPSCKPQRGPSKCKKICTPYPSYSECTKDPRKRLRAKECNCLDIVPMCEVWAEWRKQTRG